MIIQNLTTDTTISEKETNWYKKESMYFIVCPSKEIGKLQKALSFDTSTIIECIDLDENVRFSSFDGYDFISLVHFYIENDSIYSKEINLYISNNYIVLVLPDNLEFAGFYRRCKDVLVQYGKEKDIIIRLYYHILDKILEDLFKTFELIEDEIQLVEELIIANANYKCFENIIRIKKNVYQINKQVRPLLYIGDQILMNENELITNERVRYFKNIDIRINKLYDFASHLLSYCNDTLYLYDSKISGQTNNIITKLTIITLFFGPLTVITGIYGMNFTYMPELDFKYGYFIILILMTIITIILFWISKKKKWW